MDDDDMRLDVKSYRIASCNYNGISEGGIH